MINDFNVKEIRYYPITHKTTVCILICNNGHEVAGFYSHPEPLLMNELTAQKKARTNALFNLTRIVTKRLAQVGDR